MENLTIESCGAPIMPSVEELPYHGGSPLGERRFRLEGGDLAPGWTIRPGEETWCEMKIFPDGTIGSYGGSVWPMAWPELFAAIPASAQAGSAGVRLTPLGFKLLGMHVTVTPCAPSPDRRPKWLVRIDGKVAGALREYPAGLYQLDMVHALGFYETPEEATKQAIAYVEDMEKGAAHKEESIG